MRSSWIGSPRTLLEISLSWGSRMAKQTDDKARVRELEKLVHTQASQLDRLAKAKWSLPRAPKRVSGGSYIRLIVPDTHGSHAAPDAISAFLGDLSQLA